MLEQFHRARRDQAIAVLEGFHAIKHALRFGARMHIIVTCNKEQLAELAATFADDIKERLLKDVRVVSQAVFEKLAPVPPSTGVMALAGRPNITLQHIISQPQQAPGVVLERPTHLGNVGAVVRVAAAAGAVGVITTGPHDPWHATALKGSAGLHFAVPTVHSENVPNSAGPLIGIHPHGKRLTHDAVPDNSLLVFGSERHGLSKQTLDTVDYTLEIPMEKHVSSLNLATSVAVVLYTWRMSKV